MRWIALALSVAAHAAVLTWPVAAPAPVETLDFRFAVKPPVAYVVIDPRPPPTIVRPPVVESEEEG